MTIHKPAAAVYQSLSTNLHHVFTPMTVSCCTVSLDLLHVLSLLLLLGVIGLVIMQVCDDTIEEDDGEGNQRIFRVIRVPFRVVFVSGNLKMRFHVQQSRQDGKVTHMLFITLSIKNTQLVYAVCANTPLCRLIL